MKLVSVHQLDLVKADSPDTAIARTVADAEGVRMKLRHVVRHACVLTLCCFTWLLSTPLQAGVVIASTRVIYPAQEKQVTVSITNDEKEFPLLVHAWIDDGHEEKTPDQLNVPFLLTLPVFRMEPGKSQSLRITHLTDKPLPADKESVFWLNVLEVPPKPKAVDGKTPNTMQLAFRTRIKLFFRPAKLPGSVGDAPGQLRWKLVTEGKDHVLEASNPSPYFVSFESVALVSDGKENASDNPQMIAPGGTQRFPLKNLNLAPGARAQVHFANINDYGQSIPHVAELTP